MKLLIATAVTAAAVLIAGPTLGIDYVQCNAMSVAYDREMTALLNQRSNRHQAELKVVVERCGLPPIAGASEAERSSFEPCRLPAYDSAV